MGERMRAAKAGANSAADKSKEPASDQHSAFDRGSVVDALVRAQCRSNSKANCGPYQDMPGIAMICPRCPVALLARIFGAPRETSGLGKLGQCAFVAVILLDAGSWCVSSSRSRDRIVLRGRIRVRRVVGLRQRNRCQQN